MKNALRSLLGLAFCLLFSGPVQAAIPRKIVLVIFENTSYSDAINQPFFKKFADQGVLLTDFHAITHPSQPNYVALVGGSTLGVPYDGNVDLNYNHLGDLLEAKGKSWHVYAEKFPGRCFLGASKGRYARKHNPLISFKNVQGNPMRCANITDETSFLADFKLGKLADFTMYVPDLDNDGHDTDPSFADNWFSNTFAPLIQNQAAMNGVMIIALFDEDDGGSDNHIYAAMVGPDVMPGAQLTPRYDHISMLRTIEDIFAVGNLGRDDAKSSPITGFLK